MYKVSVLVRRARLCSVVSPIEMMPSVDAYRDVADGKALGCGRSECPNRTLVAVLCCICWHKVVPAHVANSVNVVTRGGSSQEPQVKAWTLTR